MLLSAKSEIIIYLGEVIGDKHFLNDPHSYKTSIITYPRIRELADLLVVSLPLIVLLDLCVFYFSSSWCHGLFCNCRLSGSYSFVVVFLSCLQYCVKFHLFSIFCVCEQIWF